MNITAFLESIPILISGMAGIFIVTGLIVGAAYLLNKIPSPKEKEDK